MDKVATQVTAILGGAVILVILLFYWFGGVQYISAVSGGTAELVHAYKGLLLPSYPSNTSP